MNIKNNFTHVNLSVALVAGALGTGALFFTWSTFPEIGKGSMLTLGSKASYLWPMIVLWSSIIAMVLRPPDEEHDVDYILSPLFLGIPSLLTGCWGFYIWHELITSPDPFYSQFLPFFALILGGPFALLFYWAGLLVISALFLECLARCIPKYSSIFYSDPSYKGTEYSEYSSGQAPSDSSLFVSESANDIEEEIGEASPQDFSSADDSGDNSSLEFAGGGQLYQGDNVFQVSNPDASFVDGVVYRGISTFCGEIGRYGDGYIYADDSYGIAIGRYQDGQIWLGDSTSGPPVAKYGGGRIFASPWIGADIVAKYRGDDDGAAAAAVILGLLER